MRIVVCVKQSPDSSSVYIDPISGQVDVERFVQVLNPADACAVEVAVRLKEQLGISGGTIMALTLGPQDAEGALRAALAIGADQAVRLWNPTADEWGPFSVAAALAAAIRQQFPMPDLVLCGDMSSDWSSGTVGPALAELLDLPQITGVAQLSVQQAMDGNEHESEDAVTLQVTRKLEHGYREQLAAQLPLLLTVTGDLNEPRYPSLPAHMAALKASITVHDPQTGSIMPISRKLTKLPCWKCMSHVRCHAASSRRTAITAPSSASAKFSRAAPQAAKPASSKAPTKN